MGRGAFRATVAGTNTHNPSRGPDSRMKQVSMKLESEVIADPKGTAVNWSLRSQAWELKSESKRNPAPELKIPSSARRQSHGQISPKSTFCL